MSAIVLDASALIAMLKGERGAAKVARAIAEARISTVTYAEVVGHFARTGMPESALDTMLAPLPLTVVPLDRALAQRAGHLRAVTSEAGLSLGERCCLALAHRDGLPAWTCDPAWKTIAEAAQVKVVMVR